jgi:hypothetical protein
MGVHVSDCLLSSCIFIGEISMAHFVMSSVGAPKGVYNAKFVAVYPTKHAEYGDGYRFEFEVLSGEFAGRLVSRVTGNEPTPANILGRLLNGLVGRELAPKEEIDVNVLVGQPYLVTVEETKPGLTRVAAVMPS